MRVPQPAPSFYIYFRSSLRFLFEAVADAAHGVDQVKMWSQFFSKRGDMHIDVAIDDESVIVVEVAEGLVAGHHLTAV